MWNEMYRKYSWYPEENKKYLIDKNQLKIIYWLLNSESKVLDLWCWKWYLWKAISKIWVKNYLWIDSSEEAILIAKSLNKNVSFLNIDYKLFTEYNDYNIIIDNWLFHILDDTKKYFEIINNISTWTYFCIRVFDASVNNEVLYNIDCWDFLINIYWYTFNYIFDKFSSLGYKIINYKKNIKYDGDFCVNYFLFRKN